MTRFTQQGYFGKRLKVWTKIRGGGHKVPFLPVWIDWEHHSYPTTPVKYLHLIVSDKYNHRRWAFSAYFYYKGV